ncbi:MAG: hypothetical protein LBH28_00670, partial [Oscillospiraceae bacterium]|nr:hypothetical protein [Oscillospiraceae bacterium]
FLFEDSFLGKEIERSGLPYSGRDFFKGRISDKELSEFESRGELLKWVAYVGDEALSDAGIRKGDARIGRVGAVVGSVAQTIRDQIDVMSPLFTSMMAKQINTVLDADRFKFSYGWQNDKLGMECILADTEPVRYYAQKRGFGGPVVMFNAACATPLYAIKLASYYLNTGEADVMLAGAHCSNETIAGICGLFDTFGVLCGVGECVPLDKNSKGLITSSGAGMFALKRLSDAERDGDRILAVVESVGLSNDGGSGGGIMTPSVKGQIMAYESAYRNGVSKDVDYIECHATGTVAGDNTEIESIDRFFGKESRPLLGALKGSTGHFFTATACASLAKVILAMEHGVIPATACVSEPMCDGIALENTVWQDSGRPRRAGINAFGFGGINAHLVLSEHNGAMAQRKSKPGESVHAKAQNAFEPDQSAAGDLTNAELAIVGMGLHIGGYRSVEEFLLGLSGEKTAFTEPSSDRWRGFSEDREDMESIGIPELPKGAYIDSFEFDTMRFTQPVIDDPYFLRRDMHLLETTAEALDDAGIQRGESPRTAVIVHSAPDYTDQLFMSSVELHDDLMANLAASCPELTTAQRGTVVSILRNDEKTRENSGNVPGMITNIRGCRISSHWGFTGPSLTVFERENSVLRCLELARFFLSEGIVDQVVVGISSFSGELEHIFVQKGLGAMRLMSGLGIAEGAVALVLKRKESALERGDRIYAAISGIALMLGASGNFRSDIETALDKALKEARVKEGAIGIFESPASYYPARGELIEEVLRNKFSQYLHADLVVPPDIGGFIGFGFSLTAAASIVRNALRFYLPELHGGKAGKKRHSGAGKPVSLITAYTREGQFGCVAMTECGLRAPREIKQVSRLVPIPIPYNSAEELERRLRAIETSSANKSLKRIYAEAWSEFGRFDNAAVAGAANAGAPGCDKRAAVLLCNSTESLRAEIALMLPHIGGLSENGFVYESARGSYCTAASDVPPNDLFGQALRISENSSAEIVDSAAEKYGVPPEVARNAGLGATALFWRPVSSLLRFGAKLLARGVSFDCNRFFENFDFYIQHKPSYIREISTGIPGFLDVFASAESRNSVAEMAPIWNYGQILEMTSGSMAKVLGDRYKTLDAYEIRARMPLPPLMLADRVTRLNATFGKLEPSSIETEYDIGENNIFRTSESGVSYPLITESSHSAILLMAFIGVDMLFDGAPRCRIIETVINIHNDSPVKGDTIRNVLEIRSFSRSGGTILVRSAFSSYCKDKLILSMELTGGFFSEQDLEGSKPSNRSNKYTVEINAPGAVPGFTCKNKSLPLLEPSAFYNGDASVRVFPSRSFPHAERIYYPPKVRLLDRILPSEDRGGAFGLGVSIAEADIGSDHWVFSAHFKNDPVFPGALLAEAANQLQRLYAINAGLIGDGDYYLEAVEGLPIKTGFLEQIKPIQSTIRFEMHHKTLRTEGRRTVLISDCNAFWCDKCVCSIENLSLVMEKKDTKKERFEYE